MAVRVAGLASTLAAEGAIVIASLVSPYAADRLAARQLHDDRAVPFLEVFLDTPLAVCRQRDPKHLYAQADRGELRGLTGIDDPYERPTNPDLTLPVQPVTESVDAVLSILATLGVRIFSARAARSGCPTDRR